jgi:hypothetical protein
MSQRCQQRSLKPTEQRSDWLFANSEKDVDARFVRLAKLRVPVMANKIKSLAYNDKN